MTDDEIEAEFDRWITAFNAHVRECEQCARHMGHVPYGLCSAGLRLFFDLPKDNE